MKKSLTNGASSPALQKEVYGSMALGTRQLYTTEDIMALPDGVRAELIDGEIFYMSSPNVTHQRLLLNLAVAFHSYQKQGKGGCETFIAPFAVFPLRDKYNYVEPDLMILCPSEEDERLQNDGIHGAPDFVLEIVSPSSRRMDYVRKLNKYSEAGVREYWIVDPSKEQITVYDLTNDEISFYTFEDKVPVGIYSDFSIDFTELDFHR